MKKILLALMAVLLLGSTAMANPRGSSRHYPHSYYRHQNTYVYPSYTWVNPYGVPVYPNVYNPMGTYNFYPAPFAYTSPYVYYPNGTVFYWAPNGFYRVR